MNTDKQTVTDSGNAPSVNTWKFKASRQVAALLDTLREMEQCELGGIAGWDATPHLENIRYAIDNVIDAQDVINTIL